MAVTGLTNFVGRTRRALGQALSPVRSALPRELQLEAMPPTLQPVDPLFREEWLAGRFPLAGTSVALLARSPFEIADAPLSWRQALAGFGWLRHLAQAAQSDIGPHAEDLVSEWLASQSRASSVASGASVVARRVLSWLTHADVVLATDDADYYDRVIEALGDDILTLERHAGADVATAAEDAARLLGAIALASAGLALSNADDLREVAEQHLLRLVSLRPSAPHASPWRVPALSCELLLELETLRRFYLLRNEPVPMALTEAVQRGARAFGMLMGGNGSLARLGSPRNDATEVQTLWLLARYTRIEPQPAGHDTMLAVARLSAGESCVVVDVGAPLRDRNALAFEMSSGDAALITHDGCDNRYASDGRGTLIGVVGGTGAQNAARWPMPPTLQAAHDVSFEMVAGAPQSLDATHAGYEQHGFAHRRRVTLSEDGRRLDVVDELRPIAGAAKPESLSFAARLVVHPSVRVRLEKAGGALLLTAPNGHTWRLTAEGHAVSAEGCAFTDGRGERQTLQVLIASSTALARTVTWSLSRLD